MLRALWFIVKVAAVLAVVIWVAERPGDIVIEWQGYIIETTVGVMVSIVAALMVVTAIVYRIWRGFVGVPEVFRRYRQVQSREKGYQAVTRGLVAVAAGDAHDAQRQAKRAQALVPDISLTRLLSAQAALMNDDPGRARVEFDALLEDKDAAFFGVRGLLNEAIRDGKQDEALEMIRKAESLQPKREWILLTLFDFETRSQEWGKAEQTLSKAVKTGAIDRDTGRRHRQAILLARADEARARGIMHAALTHARKAFSIDPSFVPAAVRTAELLDQTNKRRAAIKTIEKAWKAAPHPDLATLWQVFEPKGKSKSAEQNNKNSYEWYKRLYRLAPDHPESRRMLGRAAMEAAYWDEAREHLYEAGDFRMLAKLEAEATGNEARVREWLERAADAPPAPKWLCTSCGSAAMDWEALCHHCGNFNTYGWAVPTVDVHKPETARVVKFNTGFIEPPPATTKADKTAE